jgi:hypothetical protein
MELVTLTAKKLYKPLVLILHGTVGVVSSEGLVAGHNETCTKKCTSSSSSSELLLTPVHCTMISAVLNFNVGVSCDERHEYEWQAFLRII